ncbi:MAG: DNRLRE domain-containing protein, partial [Eubacteriales bacterium]
SSPGRQFPVVIDPTLQPEARFGRDTFISSENPDTNYNSDPSLFVGNKDGFGNTRSFLFFREINDDKENITITSATFSIFAKGGNLSSIDLHDVLVDWIWDYKIMSWNYWLKRNNPGPSLGKVIDTASGPTGGWWTFDVKKLVQKWADNPANYRGFALYPGSGSGYKEFVSSNDDSNKSHHPMLVFEYTTKPPETPAGFQLAGDTKSGLITASGTVRGNARVYVFTDDDRKYNTTADSSGEWEIDGLSFDLGEIRTISMYYEYDIEVTDEEGNTHTETITSDTTSQNFLITRYSKGARTKKMATLYYRDGTRAADIKEVNGIENELDMVVGDYVLILDPREERLYTGDKIITDPDEEYRLRDKIRPLYSNGEVVGDSIDAATGNFFALETDLSFDAVGLPIEFTRVMNSQEPENYRGPLGQNWHLGYDKMLVMYEDGSVEATGGDGGGIFFRREESEFVADSDVTERLEKNGDTYSVITKYNTVYRFDTDGMLDKITDRNGNSVTLIYNPEGLLEEVADAAGRKCRLTYDYLGRIIMIEDPEGRQVKYDYDSWGRLLQVIDPNDGITRYEYGWIDKDGKAQGNFLLTKMIDPMEYDAITNTYDDEGRVVSQKDAEEYGVSLEYGTGTTTFTDKNGNEFEYTFDSEYRVLSIEGPEVETGLPPEEPEQEQEQQVQTLGFRDMRGGVTPASLESGAGPGITGTAPSTETVNTGVSTGSFLLAQYHYDPNGYRDEVRDANGHVTYYRYDSRGNLQSVLNDEGKGTRYDYNDPANPDYPTDIYDAMDNPTHITYDGKGNMRSVRDPENNTTEYTYYYPSGQVKTVKDEADKTVTYHYDEDGNTDWMMDGRDNYTYYDYDNISRLTWVKDPEQHITSYEYDDNGNLREEITPIGETVNTYDHNNNLTATQDPEDKVTIYNYNKRGYLVEEIDPEQNHTLMGYDGNGNRLWVKDDLEHMTSYQYDALSRLRKVVDPADDEVEYYYDRDGNRIGEDDALNHRTVYEYDEFDRLEAVDKELEQRAAYTYDDLGNTLSYRDFGGIATYYEYDGLSRVKVITDDLDNSTRYTYDRSGNLWTVTNDLEKTYTYHYDDNNNLEEVIGPDNKLVAKFGYDKNNNREAVTDGEDNTTEYKYDQLNRLWKVIDPMQDETTFGWYKNGWRKSVTDGNKNTTYFDYYDNGLLWKVHDAKQNVTEYKYDGAGNLRLFIDAKKHETEYKYNKKNQLTHVINELEQTTFYQYDQNGNLDYKTDPNGNTIDYEYDDLNRLLGAYYPDESYVEYGYNEQGKREWMEDQYGTTWYDYDDLGRLTAVTNQDEMTTEYGYDELNRKTWVRYPDQKEVSYTYDDYNRLETVTDRFEKVTSYDYDKAGRRTSTSLPNGVVTTYDYNKANQMTSIASINAVEKLLAKYEYDYDDAGNRKVLKETVEGATYTTQYFYDPLNEIETVINPDDSRVEYDYDPAGNRVQMTRTAGDCISTTNYEYDEVNELTRFNVDGGPFTEFRYDKNGNRTTKIEPDDRVTTYTWDFENRLTEARFHQGKWAGFEYDGDGNRITKMSAMTQPTYKQNDGKGNDPG